MNKLVLYCKPSWRRSGWHSPLMFPFWGNVTADQALFTKQVYDSYPYDTSLYTVTDDITKAHMVFPPYRHNWLLQNDPALLSECVHAAKEASLPLLIDGIADIEHPVDIENAYVLRIGGYRFLPDRFRIQVPVAADDLLERCVQGELRVRTKTSNKPIVGFAGWATLSAAQRVRTLLKQMPYRIRSFFDERFAAMKKGVLWREEAIMMLQQCARIEMNLKARPSFSGNAKTASGNLERLRSDFVQTVLNSDYCLDVRGDANESMRLYEICSLGRIPLIVDTERNFPFEGRIDYSTFSIRVDFRELHRIGEIVADFHASVSGETFEAMQKHARDVYVRYFRTDKQMEHIIAELRARGIAL